MTEEKLTQTQKAEIYCVKHGHANYVTMCLGYVHCGRCNTLIGDRVASVFDTTNILIVGCKDKPCKVCDPIKKKLNKMDKQILKRLKKYPNKTHEEILKGVDIK